MELNGKTFIVTGAGSGLGHATAKRFLAEGANVIAVDMAAESDRLPGLEGQVRHVVADVTSPDEIQGAIDLAVSDFGGIHGAINCAGIAFAIKTVSKGVAHDLEMFRKVIDVNLVGTFNVIRLVAQQIVQDTTDEEEAGVFVNTASVAAFEGQIGQVAYTASKAAVSGMTLPIARDLSRNKIRICTIAPGLFDTRMLQMLPDEARDSLAASVPFPQRFGDPDEYARLAQHIVENAMLNGETIRIDGAIRMAPK